MTGIEDSATLLPLFLVVGLGYILTRILSSIGVVTKGNFGIYTKTCAAVIGIIYAFSIDVVKSFGVLDPLILLAGGALVAVIFWALFNIGASMGIKR